jgi:hypothetical protein
MLSNNIVFDTMLMSSIDGVKWHCKDLWKVPDLGCNLIWKNAVFVNFH